MKWILLGGVLGVLLLYPSLLAVVVAVLVAVLGKPVVVAFGVGLAARPAVTRRVRGRTA